MNVYNTGVIFEIVECFFKWVITFILCKIWDTLGFKFLDCFWKRVSKTLLNLLSIKKILFFSVRFIFSFLKIMFENDGTTVFQSVRLSVTSLICKLLKYVLVFFWYFLVTFYKKCVAMYMLSCQKKFLTSITYFLDWIFSKWVCAVPLS